MKYKFGKLIFVVPIAIVFWSWLFTTYPNVGSDISYRFESVTRGILLPYTWRNTQIGDGMGSDVTNTLWSYPSEFIFETLTGLGVPFGIQLKYLILPLALMFPLIGFYKLSKIFPMMWRISYLIYVLNSYFILLIDGGQMNLVLAVSIIPLAIYYYFNFLKGSSLNSVTKFVFAIWLIGIFDLRVVYISAFIPAAWVLVEVFNFNLSNVVKNVVLGIITVLSLIALNLFWILPSIKGGGIGFPAGYGAISEVKAFSFSSLIHSIYLQQPHWPLNSFGKIFEARWYFGFFPLAAFLPIFIINKKNSKHLVFFFLIALAGVFLAKGSQQPLGDFYIWLYQHLPGFNLFRDPSKFYSLIAFSYAMLVGIIVKHTDKSKYLNLTKYVIPICLLIFLMPLIKGEMTGSFSTPPNLESLNSIAKVISEDNTFSRSLWISNKPAMGFVSRTHPSTETFYLKDKRPFSLSVVGNYETNNFLREGNNMGELLQIAGIKYINYPYPDTRKELLKKDNVAYYFTFGEQLSSKNWISRKVSGYPVVSLQTTKQPQHIYLSPLPYAVLGSDSIYFEKYLQNKLLQNPLLFVEQIPGLLKTAIDNNLRMISFHKNEEDMIAGMGVPSDYVIPARELNDSPDATGWWKRDTTDFLWWRDFLQTKYGIDNTDFDIGAGWAVAEGNKEISISSRTFTQNKVLFARILISSKGGSIDFSQGEAVIGSVDTKPSNSEKVNIRITGNSFESDRIYTYDKSEYRWLEIGKLKNNLPVVIETNGPINVVNMLTALDERTIEKNVSIITQLESENKLIYWDRISESEKEGIFSNKTSNLVEYEQIDPTLYKVYVTESGVPSTLLFSESYNSGWSLYKENLHSVVAKSLPMYSLINGFVLERPGTYYIHYTPQKFVRFGLVISCVTFLVLTSTLVLTRERNSSILKNKYKSK